jgi:hypothetical protein
MPQGTFLAWALRSRLLRIYRIGILGFLRFLSRVAAKGIVPRGWAEKTAATS